MRTLPLPRPPYLGQLRDRAQTCYPDSPREPFECINQRRWRVRLTLSEGWSRTHSSPFKDLVRWVIIEKIYLTHIRKACPLSLRYLITLLDLSEFLGTSVWLYTPVCPLAVPGQIYRSTYQWFTWIYPPTTGGAPPWNNILPGTTNAANNYQTCVPPAPDTAATWLKKFTCIKTIENKLFVCVIFLKN